MRYVEVKSTTGVLPRFYLSEFERQFSIGHGDRFSLLVVTGIDLVKGSCDQLLWADGPIDETTCTMQLLQWTARLGA